MRIRRAHQPECEGNCPEHEGDVKQVLVLAINPFHNWGEFWYCDAAEEIDRSRGMSVTAVQL